MDRRVLAMSLAGAMLVTGVVVRADAAAGATFRLESAESGKVYGPFDYHNGTRFKIGDAVYQVVVGEGPSVQFVALADDQVSGPFDFMLGRIVRLGGDVYTLFDIKGAPRAPTRADREGVPAHLRPAVDDSAEGGEAPMVTSAPPPRPAIRVFPGYTEAGLDFSLLDEVEYDLSVANDASSTITLERDSIAVFVGGPHIRVRFRVLSDGEWDTPVDGRDLAFDGLTLSDGSGWGVAVDARKDVWSRGNWHIDVFGAAAHDREEYSLSYGSWQPTVVDTGDSTNGVGGVVTTMQFRVSSSDVELIETRLSAGGQLAYRAAHWSCYGGFTILAWSDTELDGDVTVGEESHALEMDWKDSVIVKAGAAGQLRGFSLFVDVDAGGRTAVRLGGAYRF